MPQPSGNPGEFRQPFGNPEGFSRQAFLDYSPPRQNRPVDGMTNPSTRLSREAAAALAVLRFYAREAQRAAVNADDTYEPG
jgi:hypothetical protein